jgi:hypothetical protein
MTGGEPVVHPPPPSIIHHATRLSSRVYIYTLTLKKSILEYNPCLQISFKKDKEPAKKSLGLGRFFHENCCSFEVFEGFLDFQFFSPKEPEFAIL